MTEESTTKLNRRTVMQGTVGAGLLGLTGVGSSDEPNVQEDQSSDPKRHLPPDTVYTNGRIVTMDDTGYNDNPGRIVEAMAVRNEKIVALGAEEEVVQASLRAQEEATDTQIVDLQGKMVLPGFVAAHIYHFRGAGMDRSAKDVARETFELTREPNGYYMDMLVESTAEEVKAKLEDAVNTLRETVNVGEEQWIGIHISPDPDKGFPSTASVSNLGDARRPEDAEIDMDDLDEIVSDRYFHVGSGYLIGPRDFEKQETWYHVNERAEREEVASFEWERC